MAAGAEFDGVGGPIDDGVGHVLMASSAVRGAVDIHEQLEMRALYKGFDDLLVAITTGFVDLRRMQATVG